VQVDAPDLRPPPYAEVIEAQQGAVACNGELISVIEIRRYPPSVTTAATRAAAAASGAVGLDGEPMRQALIRAYLRLKEGRPCVELERSESERLLRAQRFIAAAAVVAVPEPDGRVRILVAVVEELPWVVGGRLKGARVASARLGTLNFGGRGLTIIGAMERRQAYRTGVGAVVAQHGMLGRPAVATLEVDRRPLGGLLHVGLTEPFQTDGQRRAGHGDFRQETMYGTLVRAGADDAAARIRRTSFDVGWVQRIGTYREGRLIGLAGAMFMGTDVRSADQAVVVSDSGIVPLADSELVGRFPDYGVGRLMAMGGVRALRFVTVRGYDALRAEQDVGVGVQATLLVGPSLWHSGPRDVLLIGDLYAGSGKPTSFFAARTRVESRRASGAGGWQGTVASMRLSWHRLGTDSRTRIMSLSAGSVHRLPFPAQLTLRDLDGGLAAFSGSRAAGGQRLVFRAEERWLLGWRPRRADVAIAAFTDAGRLWAGDVPYGNASPVRASVGFGLLASGVSGGKRLLRLDIAFPINPEPGGSRVVFRFTSADRTGMLWLEPRDLARARSGSGPTTLMRW
jgi:hypothetical protein